MSLGKGFRVHNIKDATDLAGLCGPHQGFGIHEGSATCVDYDGSWPKTSEELGIDHSRSRRCQRQGNNYDVGGTCARQEALHSYDAIAGSPADESDVAVQQRQ